MRCAQHYYFAFIYKVLDIIGFNLKCILFLFLYFLLGLENIAANGGSVYIYRRKKNTCGLSSHKKKIEKPHGELCILKQHFGTFCIYRYIIFF